MGSLVVDCPTGLAGDMLLAACLDLGVSRSCVEQPLSTLGLDGAYRLVVEESHNGGLRGLQLDVEAVAPQTGHRHWRDLRRQIDQAPLDSVLKQRVLAVFSALAQAEAAVQNIADQVHFHEVERRQPGGCGGGVCGPHGPGTGSPSLSRSAIRSRDGADRAWLPARARSCRFGIGTALSGPPAVRSGSAQWGTDHAYGIGSDGRVG